MVVRKVLICFLLLGSILSSVMVYSQPTGSQGIGVSPAIAEVEVVPGRVYELQYVVENNTGVDNLPVDITIETIKEGSIQGSANVFPFESAEDISFWLSITKEQTLKLQEKKTITYQLTIPDNVAPGAYFFAIVYQPRNQAQQKSGNSTLKLQTRIATLLFVNIGGDTSKQPEIRDFKLNTTWIDPVLDRLDIDYTVGVKGNSFYRPLGNIFLSEPTQDSVTTLGSFTSENLILPGSSRGYNYCGSSSIYIGASCKSTLLQKDLPWFGTKTLTLRLDYNDGIGNPQTIVTERQIILFPYKVLSILVGSALIFVLLYNIIYYYRKKYYEKR